MSFVATAAIAAAIINAALGVFIFLANPRSSLNRIYALWSGSVVLWNLSAFFVYLPGTSHDAAMIWIRILQGSVIFMPVLCVHLSQLTADGKAAHWLRYFYLLHAGFALSLGTPWFVSGVQLISVGWWAVAGPLFWAFLASYTALIVPMLVRLPGDAASAQPMKRKRIRALWFALLILGILGTNDLMPVLGLANYPGTTVPFLPLGNLGAIFYGVAVGYSVLQHQLLDIQIGLSRAAAYAVRLLFLVLIGGVLLLALAIVTPRHLMTPFAFWTALGVLLLSGLIASIIMPKLLGGGTESFERRLLGDHFEYQDKIRAFIEQSRWRTELGPLLSDLNAILTHVVDVRSYWLILLDETNRAFSLVRAKPECIPRQIPNLRVDSPVFQFLRSDSQGYLTLKSEDGTHARTLEIESREQLLEFPGVLALPLFVEEQPLGLLILGEKNSGEMFTRTDAQLLRELMQNIALVISQISIKTQLLESKELDLLGRMSQGMAHDLNNLMTPVWTMLQLLDEGASAEALRVDMAPVALRNLQTMRDYIKEALFFSEHLRPDFQIHRLDTLVEEVVELAKQNKRRGKVIHYAVQTCGELSIEMDQVLIRRLLTNLLANAVDASRESGTIDVAIIRLIKTDTERDWFRIRISDHGSGIARENLDRIFQPYFSTKKTGDANRGFGLGLAISRKIASLHSANLVVSSEVGRGTTVNLDLPSRQKAAKNSPVEALAMNIA